MELKHREPMRAVLKLRLPDFARVGNAHDSHDNLNQRPECQDYVHHLLNRRTAEDKSLGISLSSSAEAEREVKQCKGQNVGAFAQYCKLS